MSAQCDPVLTLGPQLGDRVRFIPSANFDRIGGFPEILKAEVTGTIVFIHQEHRWYRVKYIMGSRSGCIGYECFKY